MTRPEERSEADAAERLRRMTAAQSATNEALLKAPDEQEMFRLVCEAVAETGLEFGAGVYTIAPGGTRLECRPYAGRHAHLARPMPLSLVPGHRFAGSLHNAAMEQGRIQIAYDLRADARCAPWMALTDETPYRGCGATPLTRGGEPVGVLFFFFGEISPERERPIIDVMERIGQNVSFKLDAIEAERRTAMLNRMMVKLGGVNEAIIHARTPDELFASVCDVASEGGATLGVAVLMHDADTATLRHRASAGRLGEPMRGFRIPCDPAAKRGGGLIAKAFVEQEPVFVADIENEPRYMPFRKTALDHGIRAVASLPLYSGIDPVGILLFLLGEGDDVIDAETQGMKLRIAQNVSFALDNFAREAARARLARMLAALSATNEAIVRAKTREELFAMAAEAAEGSGNFTSVTVVMKDPASGEPAIAAVVGSAREVMGRVRYSADAAHPNGRGLVGNTLRAGRPVHSNDYLANPDYAAFHAAFGGTGQRSGACVPLRCRGETVGALLLMSAERNTFNPEYLDLIERFGQNVSLALDNFASAEEREKADQRIQYLATHDEMTALPNRAAFSTMLNGAIRRSKRGRSKFALLFIDLDRFKVINDTLGHEAGDALLVETGKRITGCLRADDFVARLGGDEFVVILNEVRSREGAAAAAKTLMAAVGRPIELSGHECRVSGSIGIAMYPEHGEDEQTLMKRADMAMYAAKEDGKNDFRFFSADVKAQSVERLMMEASLRHALERDQFVVHYQPKVDLATGQVSGVEALIRWNHPDLGMVSPAAFVPLAEETGLIVPIGRWVLREACRQNMEWQNTGVGPVRMAVNLSPRQFSDESLLRDIDGALADSGMPSELLQLEVTESMVMQNVERAIAMLDAIKRRGVHLAIDDFGTGYSSLSLLRRFPVDTLKIDRSFVKDLPSDQEDVAITQAIISMAKALGLTVVAEGVETVEQRTFLDRQACDEMQGYLFSKPLPADQLAALLLAQPPAAPLAPDQPRDRRRIPDRRGQPAEARDRLAADARTRLLN